MMEAKNTKREREYTFVISRENILNVLNCIIRNRKNFVVDDQYFMLEKGSEKLVYQFLMSNNYDATREKGGTRTRLSIIPKKGKMKIVYTEKELVDGHRYESSKTLDSFSDAMSILHNKPPIDCILAKYSLKYRCVNHATGSAVVLRLDCCYAINPTCLDQYSPPFFLFEIEEDSGISIEQFMLSNVMHVDLHPYLEKMPYSGHNRIRMCKEYYPNSIFDSSKLEESIVNLNHIFLDNAPQYNYFSRCDDKYLKGSKAVERSNGSELEFKFIPQVGTRHIINYINSILPTEYQLIKTPARVITDIYFDDRDFFYKNNLQLRIRHRKKNDGWVACFKSPMQGSSNDVLVRNKVRSMATIADVTAFTSGQDCSIDAFTSTKLYLQQNYGLDTVPTPATMVIQYRDRYVVRRRLDYHGLCSESIESYKNSDLVHIIFDNVEAIDLSNVCFSYLINSDEILIPNSGIETKTFISAEIEPNLRADVIDSSTFLFNCIVKQLSNSPFILRTQKSKYEMSLTCLRDVPCVDSN